MLFRFPNFKSKLQFRSEFYNCKSNLLQGFFNLIRIHWRNQIASEFFQNTIRSLFFMFPSHYFQDKQAIVEFWIMPVGTPFTFKSNQKYIRFIIPDEFQHQMRFAAFPTNIPIFDQNFYRKSCWFYIELLLLSGFI